MKKSNLIPIPLKLIKKYPSNQWLPNLNHYRNTIKAILEGSDPRFLLIVGPCSIHDPAAAKEYALRLKKLADIVSDTFFVVMRVYYEKPRTSLGWTGFMYDPTLTGEYHLSKGLEETRKLLFDITEIGLPIGTEFLDPLAVPFLSDFISWGCIGARTSSSQIHRQMASGLPMAIGFKNSIEGNIEIAVNGALYASHPHTFLEYSIEGQLQQVATQGNPDTHLILRGGENKPNYDSLSIAYALDLLEPLPLNKKILIDCSHDNSLKQHERQLDVFKSICNQISEGNKIIKGILLESNLHAGNQKMTFNPSQLQYGISITDSCLDWNQTEQLILSGQKKLSTTATLTSR